MSRYDTRTTVFNQEGGLAQVEYAMKATSNSGNALGILTDTGVILASQKQTLSKLLDSACSEKIYRIDKHIICTVAGVASDANYLIDYARTEAQRWLYAYNELIPVEALAQKIADYKQSYTQFGGLRPFGVTFLFAGFDPKNGFQLYQTDPAGNIFAWVATAIGKDSTAIAATLKQSIPETHSAIGLSLENAKKMAVNALVKASDITVLTPDKFEVVELFLENKDDKVPTIHNSDVTDILKQAIEEKQVH